MTIEQRAKQAFCTLLGAPSWPYTEEPSHFYRTWERFLDGGQNLPWEGLEHALQREAKQKMYELIHHLYCKVAGLIEFAEN